MSLQITYKPEHELVDAEYNPRKLEPEQRRAILDSLKRFGFSLPAIVNVHPDRENIIIGGHQRRRIVVEEWEKHETRFDLVRYEDGQILIPCVERELTLAQEKELNARLNKNTASWDWRALATYDRELLEEWGFEEDLLDEVFEDMEDPDAGRFQDPEIEFTEQMILDHNYVVLYFDNPMDWEVAKDKLGLKKVKELLQIKEPTKGLGRVIPGKDVIDLIHE